LRLSVGADEVDLVLWRVYSDKVDGMGVGALCFMNAAKQDKGAVVRAIDGLCIIASDERDASPHRDSRERGTLVITVLQVPIQ
jgi:hypothetical protein